MSEIRRWVLIAAWGALALPLAAQNAPQPVKPSATYLKHLQRHKQIAEHAATEQRKLNAKLEKERFEDVGLFQWLTTPKSRGGEVPDGYDINTDMELFIPQPPAPPKTESKPEQK